MAKTASWDVTGRCNLRCLHCGVKETYRQFGGDELSLEEARVMFRHLREDGYVQLLLLGGEPLMRRDIAELVREAKLQGFAGVRIVTNGTTITPTLSKALVEAGLEGPDPESNDPIRGKGTFARAIAGLDTFLESRGDSPKPRVGLQLTLGHTIMDKAPRILDLAHEKGLDWVSINEMKMAGAVLEDPDQLVPSLNESLDAREALVERSLQYPEMELQVYGKNRVLDYLNERYGATLSLGARYCDLINDYQTLCIEASGIASPCSLIHVSERPDEEKQAQKRLHTSPVAEAVLSPSYYRIEQVANQAVEERWQASFAPCAACEFLPRCNICPVVLQELKEKIIFECLLATQRRARWRKAQRQAQQQNQEQLQAQNQEQLQESTQGSS